MANRFQEVKTLVYMLKGESGRACGMTMGKVSGIYPGMVSAVDDGVVL